MRGGVINIICPSLVGAGWHFTKCIQSYSAGGVGYGMKQDNLAFGGRPQRVSRSSSNAGPGSAGVWEEEQEGVMALVVWQYSALVGITHEKISNGTTEIFPSRCLKKSYNSKWPPVETDDCSSKLVKQCSLFFFYFVPFCGSVPVASFKSPASLFERGIWSEWLL